MWPTFPGLGGLSVRRDLDIGIASRSSLNSVCMCIIINWGSCPRKSKYHQTKRLNKDHQRIKLFQLVLAQGFCELPNVFISERDWGEKKTLNYYQGMKYFKNPQKRKIQNLKVCESGLILKCKILNNKGRDWSCDVKKCHVSTKNSLFHPWRECEKKREK